jgi:hypothetical protein
MAALALSRPLGRAVGEDEELGARDWGLGTWAGHEIVEEKAIDSKSQDHAMIQIALPEAKVGEFCRKWKITELALFGSVLREDFRPASDVDVLVSFEPQARWSLMDVVGMQDELETILGRKVDLVERSAIERSENYIRRRYILESAEPVYVAR